MARRRDARVASSSDRRRSRVEPSAQTNKEIGDSSSNRRLAFIFVFFFVLLPTVSVYMYSIKFISPTSSGQSYVPRHSRVKADINYEEILSEHARILENTSKRHYIYPVLAYITPWNSMGYEMAKKFNSKFTHLSPVWYDLKSQGTDLVLEGRHNADKGWLSELRKSGNALVLPRVVLEAFPKELLRNMNQRKKAINLIVQECKEMEYDGIVLESWSRWLAYGILNDPDLRSKALQFIKQLGNALHSVSSRRNDKQNLQLIYVIGPPYSEKLQPYDFGPNDIQSLSEAVDGFSLMTYDFSNPQNPGPNAPLKWIRLILQVLIGDAGGSSRSHSHKIFLGINFYGNDFMITGGAGGGPITGRDYLTLLEKHRPVIRWEEGSAEHFFLYSDEKGVQRAVFYPSLMSISMRLEEARVWGLGISIWEIGQGLECFFDLF